MRESSPSPEQEYDPAIEAKQREIRENLHDLDDVLLKAADLPDRDSLRGLIAAASRLAETPPFSDPHGSRYGDVRDKTNKALEPLGFEVRPIDTKE